MNSVKHIFIALVLPLIPSIGFTIPHDTGFVQPVIKNTNLVDGTISIVDDLARHTNKTVVLFHSCNLQHSMGDAAGAVKDAMPETGKADDQTPKNDTHYLGGWSEAEMETQNGNKFRVLNLYSQQYGGLVSNAQDHLKIIKNGLENIAKEYPSDQYILVYPQFSAGVAGRNWKKDIEPLVDSTLGKHTRYQINWDKSVSKTPKLKGRTIGHFQPEKPIVLPNLKHKKTGDPHQPDMVSVINEDELTKTGEIKEVDGPEKWYQTKTAKAVAAVSAIAVIATAIGLGYKYVTHKHSKRQPVN